MVVHLTNGGRTSPGMVGVFVFVLLICLCRDTDMDVSVTNFQLHIFVVLGILTGLIMVISELVKKSRLIAFKFSFTPFIQFARYHVGHGQSAPSFSTPELTTNPINTIVPIKFVHSRRNYAEIRICKFAGLQTSTWWWQPPFLPRLSLSFGYLRWKPWVLPW